MLRMALAEFKAIRSNLISLRAAFKTAIYNFICSFSINLIQLIYLKVKRRFTDVFFKTL